MPGHGVAGAGRCRRDPPDLVLRDHEPDGVTAPESTSDSRTAIFSAVVLDRVFGILALLVLSTLGVGFALATGFEGIPAGLLEWLLLPLGGALLVLLLFGSRALQRSRMTLWLQGKLPPALGRLMASLRVVAKSYRVLGGCLLLSLASQIFTVLSFVFIGMVIRDQLPVLFHFIVNPLALLLNGVPITPAGYYRECLCLPVSSGRVRKRRRDRVAGAAEPVPGLCADRPAGAVESKTESTSSLALPLTPCRRIHALIAAAANCHSK